MSHQLLAAIRLAHPYYADGRCRALALSPDPTTARRLAGRRIVAKARVDGLDLLAEVDGEGRPLIALEPGLSLSFELRETDGALDLFSDLEPFRALSSARLRNTDGPELVLGEGELPLARGRLASVEIADVEGSWTADPPTFTARFAPREARWVYYWVGEANELAIVDGDPGRVDAPIEFELEPATPEGDRIAADLAHRYPDRTRLRLVSRAALACRATPRRHLSLRAGDEVVRGELPNPALRNQSFVTRAGERQASLYQVLATS